MSLPRPSPTVQGTESEILLLAVTLRDRDRFFLDGSVHPRVFRASLISGNMIPSDFSLWNRFAASSHVCFPL